MVKIFNYENDSKEFAANTYIIGKINGDCVVIDMGSTDEKIYEYIDAHYEKVEAVLLTHAHFDHIRGLSKFIRHYKNKYDIPVYLSGEDEELLKDPHLNSSLMMIMHCSQEILYSKDLSEELIFLPANRKR